MYNKLSPFVRWLSLLTYYAIAALVILTSSTVLAATPAQTQASATVIIQALNLRTGPGLSFARVGSVKQGDVLTVLAQADGCRWLQVRTAQNVEGWVSGAKIFVKLNGDCKQIAAVRPPAQLGSDFGSLVAVKEFILPDLPVSKAMGATWTRVELPWLRIEPTRGAFDWSAYDIAMKEAKRLSIRVLVVIHSPPTWAATESCGPVSDTAALTAFITAAVNRYRDTAFAWEFINEPDGVAPLPNYGPTIGCWAPFPAQYAQQLAIFYKTVKALSPNTPVMFGSLAHDNWGVFDREFLNNALANGAVGYFDLLGMHYYPINPVEFPTVREKINALRSVLSKYGLGNTPIWITETSTWTNKGLSLDTQKDFIVNEQTRAFCNGVDLLFWFAIQQQAPEPALYRWLINLQHQPDQGYYTYQHYASQIQGRRCLGSAPNLPAGVEGYGWGGNGKADLYILWSSSGNQAVTLPAASYATLINRDGGDKRTVNTQNGVVTVEVGAQALFVLVDR